MVITDWRQYFPEATIRPLQEEILDFITTYFDDADVFAIEAPPGVGKSAIAVCLASWFHERTRERGYETPNELKSYITTTTVNLEDQYMRSYRNRGLKQLHSASHYQCTRKDKNGHFLSCEQGQAISSSTKSKCPGNDYCPYKLAKGEFVSSPFGIVNAAYLFTESTYIGKLGKRGLLISDEGHTLCEAICNFLDFRVTPKSSLFLGLKFPDVKEGPKEMNELLTWLKDQYRPRLLEKMRDLRFEIENLSENPEDPILLTYLGDNSRCEADLGRLNALLANVNPTDWVLERGQSKGQEFYSLAPITAKGFSGKILSAIAPKIVLLSATLIDFEYHREELEIPEERLAVFQAPSPFPKENRPIYAIPRVKLDHKNLEATASEAAEIIAPILESHSGQRGIIFTSSYAQARAIRDIVNAKTGLNRLRTHEGSGGKDLLLRMHESIPDSVIVSPSMHEGVDLKGDLSRFQIITKLPFPSLGSKVVKRKMEVQPTWYSYTTTLKLIQATGRSIRTETDEAATYIIDQAFDWFYSRNTDLFPEYWRAALTFL
jgi:ATP-dependent DNA helicase DinG